VFTYRSSNFGFIIQGRLFKILRRLIETQFVRIEIS